MCDYVIVLDETLWNSDVLSGFKPESIVIINTADASLYEKETAHKIIAVDATNLAIEYLGIPITNTAMLGALIGVTNIVDAESCKSAIRASMNPKLADKNIALFEHVVREVKTYE